MPADTNPRDELILRALLEHVEAGQIFLYRNILQNSYVAFRVADRPAGVFLLHDDAVRNWIADFAWDGGLGLVQQRELDRIITVLAGRAMRSDHGQIGDAAAIQLIESEPVVAVALEFMQVKRTDKHETNVETLWIEWRDFANERGLLKLGRRRFPGGPNVLSRVLRRFAEPLRALGVSVSFRRSNGSHVVLERLSDDAAFQSSAQPSVPKPCQNKDLASVDDRAARVARLRERKSKGQP